MWSPANSVGIMLPLGILNGPYRHERRPSAINTATTTFSSVSRRAQSLGVRSVPAVAIDGELAGCCAGRGPEEAALRAAGLGQALP